MKNYSAKGDTVQFTAPGGGVVGGNAYLIGALLVVATVTVAAGLPFAGETRGIFELPKTAGAAWAEGQLLYWDSATSSVVTAQSATARRIGCAAAAQLAGDVLGMVRLSGDPSVVNVA